MALKLITPPATYPVSLEEAKAHLRVDDDDDDALITLLINAATGNAEQFLGRALIDQTWELTLDSFPTSEVKIPLPPLIEVVSITYDDAVGEAQVLSADDYTVDLVSEPGWVVPNDYWPTLFDAINAVRIRFRAGYLDTNSPPAAAVPFDIKAAVLLNLGALYEHRETVVIGQTATALPWGAEQLLRPHRVNLGMA